MKIQDFVKSVLPSVSKDTVLEDCRASIGELKDTVAPVYKQGAELFKNWKFKTPEAQQLNKTFAATAKHARNNLVVTIDEAIAGIVANAQAVEDLIKKTYSEDVAAAGITYLKAQLLQYVEALSFFNKYARAVLNHLYVVESATFVEETDQQHQAVEDQLVPAQIQYVQNNIISFAIAFNALSLNHNDLKKQLAEIPEITITTDNIQGLAATVGDKKLDPFMFGLIPVWMNPIYHIGMAYAEWQVENYNKAKIELQLLQMRKMNMELLIKGTPNPKLQKEIDYTASRIQGLQAKLAKMERDYA